MSSTTAFIELFEKDFVIPHYQRGYRWEEQEVTELLDDIWYFSKTANNGEFYCLQPIVVQKTKEREDSYNVLDGQQRLTTLFLIITYLEERRFEDGYNQELFTLNYETRPESEIYLEEGKFKAGIDDSNIDFYHISNSYDYIKKWFSSHAGAKNKLIPILLDITDVGNKNIRFIWYEVAETTNPIDVFIRLNVGKIALTDAELIKALVLQSDKYTEEELPFNKMRLFQIASEWDNIEYTLQNEEFWYFLNNTENTKATHIEFIFDAIANKILKERKYFESRNFKHATFLILSKYLDDIISNEGFSRIDAVKHIWEKVIEYFEYYKEWFNNRKLYHYIGYLIELKSISIIDVLITQSKSLTKDAFEEYLIDEIGKIIRVSKVRRNKNGEDVKIGLKDLCYENEDNSSNDKPLITSILLLHNVVSTLNSEKEKAKFPFHLYKKTTGNEKWSLEHIHAQNSNSISNADHQNTWLRDHIKSLKNLNKPSYKELLKRMKNALKNEDLEKETFDAIYNEVYKLMNAESGLNEANAHLIENLCLLDKNTNSQLNNSVFDVKREKIKKRELQGFYIPICSRNVFLKAYTDYPKNNAYWSKQDRKGYLKSIKKTYKNFVKD